MKKDSCSCGQLILLTRMLSSPHWHQLMTHQLPCCGWKAPPTPCWGSLTLPSWPLPRTTSDPSASGCCTSGVEKVLSVTKYLAGHSDVVLGALVTSNPELRAALLHHRIIHGGIAGPFEAWLALRGLRTLALRVERSQASAAELARRLQDHPLVESIRYPGLPSDPGHTRARAQMKGFGAIVCIQVAPVAGLDGAAAADALVSAVDLWLPATSLGGVESLIERRRRHVAEPTSVPANLVRLSVGIENVEDLWADLEQAFTALSR